MNSFKQDVVIMINNLLNKIINGLNKYLRKLELKHINQ
jgi:hypothetical protein